jgi:hypothetical protein
MHAVVVKVTINDEEEGLKFLREQVVPRVSQAPGLKAGYWVRLPGNKGTSVIVFESEDAARAVADQISPPPSGATTLDSVDVGEVVANA